MGKKWITTQDSFKKSILDKWWNENFPFISPRWNIIWHKHKAHKEMAFFWSIIHKVVAVNEWRGRISMEIDKNYPHCGPRACGVDEAHIL